MSAGELARLIRMANQIATAFEGQGGQAARDTAGHIRAFWARPMREDIVRHLQAGGEGLNPTARAAVEALTAASPAVGSGA